MRTEGNKEQRYYKINYDNTSGIQTKRGGLVQENDSLINISEQIDSKKDKKSDVQQSYSEAQEEFAQADEQYEENISSIETQIEAALATVSALTGALAGANSTLAQAQSTLSATPETILQEVGIDEETGEPITEEVANPDYASAKEAVSAAEQQVAAIEAELAAAQAASDEVSAELAEYSETSQDEEETMATAAQEYETQLDDITKEIDDLEAQYATEEAKLEQEEASQEEVGVAGKKTEYGDKETEKLLEEWTKYAQEHDYDGGNTKDVINRLAQDGRFGRGIVDAASEIDCLLQNKDWKVDMDIDGDGAIDEDVELLDAIAASSDSVLDVYIQDALQDLMEQNGTNLRSLFGTKDAVGIRELAKLGIQVDAVGDSENWQNRTYSFKLMDISAYTDENGQVKDLDAVIAAMYPDDGSKSKLEILQDQNGNMGDFIFSDCLIPDGYAQGAEINLASILDGLGGDRFNVISKADFMDMSESEFDNMMKQIGEAARSGKLESSGRTVADVYKDSLNVSTAVRAVYTANGNAPGNWGGSMTFEETLRRIQTVGLGSDGQGGDGGARYNSSAANGEIYSGSSSGYNSDGLPIGANGEIDWNSEEAQQAKEMQAAQLKQYYISAADTSYIDTSTNKKIDSLAKEIVKGETTMDEAKIELFNPSK